MTTHYDVPAALLLPAVATKLGELDVIKQPEWAEDVKTGANREKPPTQGNWWEMRCAAILRKVARMGPIGVIEHLKPFLQHRLFSATVFEFQQNRTSPTGLLGIPTEKSTLFRKIFCLVVI